MTPLQALPSGPDRPFVCPWCGSRFEHRHIASDGIWSLEEHWRRSPECSANRAVNNPTQTKHDVHDSEVPGLVLPDREDRDA